MREILFRGFHPCDGPDTIATTRVCRIFKKLHLDSFL